VELIKSKLHPSSLPPLQRFLKATLTVIGISSAVLQSARLRCLLVGLRESLVRVTRDTYAALLAVFTTPSGATPNLVVLIAWVAYCCGEWISLAHLYPGSGRAVRLLLFSTHLAHVVAFPFVGLYRLIQLLKRRTSSLTTCETALAVSN